MDIEVNTTHIVFDVVVLFTKISIIKLPLAIV